MDRTFQFDFEAEIFEKGGKRLIGGIVSTDDLDLQREVIVQEGLDFGPFMKAGFFNDNHDRATGSAVGVPTHAEMRQLPGGRKGWYVEGELYKTRRADEIWELANELSRSSPARKLGFSVEGAIVDRDRDNQRKVLKAEVREVAITRCPINGNTSLDILAKALSAGGDVSDPGAAPGQGFALRAESLESRPAKKRRKRMKKGEAIEFLRRIEPKVSAHLAERIVDYALRHHPAA